MERLRKESYGKIGKSKGQTTFAPEIPNLGGLTTTIQRTSVRWRPKQFTTWRHYANQRQRRSQVARTTTVRRCTDTKGDCFNDRKGVCSNPDRLLETSSVQNVFTPKRTFCILNRFQRSLRVKRSEQILRHLILDLTPERLLSWSPFELFLLVLLAVCKGHSDRYKQGGGSTRWSLL